MIENQGLSGVSEPGLLCDCLICCCHFSCGMGSASPFALLWGHTSLWHHLCQSCLGTQQLLNPRMIMWLSFNVLPCVQCSIPWHLTKEQPVVLPLLPWALHLVDVSMFQNNVVHLISDWQAFDQHKAQVSGLEVPCEGDLSAPSFSLFSFCANAPWL